MCAACSAGAAMSILVRHLENFGALDDRDRETLRRIIARTKDLPADHDIAREGECPIECAVVLEGLVARYKLLPSGKRQIVAFHIPGDMIDLHGFLLRLDHNIGTLTTTKLGYIPHEALNHLLTNWPRICRALWRVALVDAAIFRERLTSIGRRSAAERLAHLLCELFCRYRAVGLTDNLALDVAVTQAELGDALGLSYVHVNRLLQTFRGEGLIRFRGTTLVIDDWPGLKRRGEFNDGYLHVGDLTGEPGSERS